MISPQTVIVDLLVTFSTDKEIIICIQEALESRRVDPESFLARIEGLNSQMPAPPLTDKMLRRAGTAGRP
jgi:hypothetical protein